MHLKPTRSPFSDTGSQRMPPSNLAAATSSPRARISSRRSSANMETTFSITADFPLRGNPVTPIFGCIPIFQFHHSDCRCSVMVVARLMNSWAKQRFFSVNPKNETGSRNSSEFCREGRLRFRQWQHLQFVIVDVVVRRPCTRPCVQSLIVQ